MKVAIRLDAVFGVTTAVAASCCGGASLQQSARELQLVFQQDTDPVRWFQNTIMNVVEKQRPNLKPTENVWLDLKKPVQCSV